MSPTPSDSLKGTHEVVHPGFKLNIRAPGLKSSTSYCSEEPLRPEPQQQESKGSVDDEGV